MSKNEYRHIYGPVPSRRLGRSLGIDIVPYKVCSFDCIYCQLGRTTELTTVPRPLVPSQEILSELKAWLASGDTADYITFAGSGEPTLHSELADMIGETCCMTDLPVAVITNGSLLCNPEVRNAVMNADLLVPSLDAGTQAAFEKVNRPAQGLDFNAVADGLVRTRQQFQGDVWLEVMLVKDFNDSESELQAIAEITRRIEPDRIQVNTVERPSRSGNVSAVPQQTLEEAARIFGPRAEIVVSKKIGGNVSKQDRSSVEAILNLLSRRPCTLDDISAATGMHLHEVSKHLRRLTSDGLVASTGLSADPYYYLAERHRGVHVQR